MIFENNLEKGLKCQNWKFVHRVESVNFQKFQGLKC